MKYSFVNICQSILFVKQALKILKNKINLYPIYYDDDNIINNKINININQNNNKSIHNRNIHKHETVKQ